MDRLLPIDTIRDIPAKYEGTPIGRLLEYHNLDRAYDTYEQAQLLVAMCMDYRKGLFMPEYFAYVIRTGGATLQFSDFHVSYAVAVGGIKHIAIIGHNNCGMAHVTSRRDEVIEGLVANGGWDRLHATKHFDEFATMFEIGNEVDFVLSEVGRLRQGYPKVTVCPMLYRIEDGRLYLIQES